MRLKAKFAEVVLDVETENEDRAVALFGTWLWLVNRVISDSEAPEAKPPVSARETHH